MDLKEFEYEGRTFSFTEKLLKEYEVKCIKALNYNLDCTTVNMMIKFFFGTGLVFNNDLIIKCEEEDIKIPINSPNVLKLKSKVATNFYSEGSLSEKIYSLAINVLDNYIEGKNT